MAFNRIHKSLSKMVPTIRGDIFSQLVAHGAKKHSIIRMYKDELIQFAKLRNAIVHEKLQADYYIAEPHEQTVLRIEEIANHFEKPVMAITIAKCPVFYLNDFSSIKNMIHIIQEKSHTKFPIYRDGTCIGLLTTGGVMKWMAEHITNNLIDLTDIKVSDVFPYERNHLIDFVDQHKNIFDVEELFEKNHANNKKLEAVVITENGNRNEKPLGIITSWDLIEIDNFVQ